MMNKGIQKVKELLRTMLRRLPLLSGLADSEIEGHIEAAKEVLSSMVIATSPIWLASIVIYARDQNLEKTWDSYKSTLISLIIGGELFIYCSAIVAPIFYIVVLTWRRQREFPGRLSIILSGVIVIGVSFTFYGIQKAGAWVDVDFIFPLSYYLFAFSIVLYYIVKVYDNARVPDLSAISKIEEDEFTDKFRRHKG